MGVYFTDTGRNDALDGFKVTVTVGSPPEDHAFMRATKVEKKSPRSTPGLLRNRRFWPVSRADWAPGALGSALPRSQLDLTSIATGSSGSWGVGAWSRPLGPGCLLRYVACLEAQPLLEVPQGGSLSLSLSHSLSLSLPLSLSLSPSLYLSLPLNLFNTPAQHDGWCGRPAESSVRAEPPRGPKT
jgi:hypothetical protein